MIFLLMVFGIIGVEFVASHLLNGASAPPAPAVVVTRPITYTIVAGDTPRSIASQFAADRDEIARLSGVNSVETPLTAGLQLTLDANLLWSAMNQGSTATNAALVVETARHQGVEPALALAVAWQESRLDESARSSAGAIGIMQVEPDTSRLASQDLGVTIDPRQAADNVTAGLFWLHSLLSSYGGDRSSALAAYYEGPGNLSRQGYLSGTAEYVSHALQLRHALLAANPALAS